MGRHLLYLFLNAYLDISRDASETAGAHVLLFEGAGTAALRRMSWTVASWRRDGKIRLKGEEAEESPHENKEKRGKG